MRDLAHFSRFSRDEQISVIFLIVVRAKIFVDCMMRGAAGRFIMSSALKQNLVSYQNYS